MNLVNQAFRIKIAYRSEKKKKEEEENTRDRSVPDGSDKYEVQVIQIILWDDPLFLLLHFINISGE